MSGYIKTHRKIDDNALLGVNHQARHVFLDLLRWACWRDTVFDVYGQPVTLKRGSLMISRAQLSERTGLSQRNIRTIISALTNHNIIKIDQPVTSGPMVISICNYSQYQEDRPDPVHESDQTATRQRPVKEEREEVKKEEEELSLAPPPDGGEAQARQKTYPDWFERFWSAYPGKRKQLKGKCLDLARTAISAKMATPQQFAKAIEEKRGCNKDPEFQMAPERWLRNKGWLDDVPEWADVPSNGNDKMSADEFADLLRQHGYSEEQINEQTRAMQ